MVQPVPVPEWLELARCLGRGPLVVLHSNVCWRCGDEGLAVVLAFVLSDEDDAAVGAAEALWNRDVDSADEDAEYISLIDKMTVAFGAETIAYLAGGQVAHPVVVEQAGAFTPVLPLKLATFKERYSRTVEASYISQGCPHCDALWGDFPLGEAAFEIVGERMDAGYFRRDGCFVFQLEL